MINCYTCNAHVAVVFSLIVNFELYFGGFQVHAETCSLPMASKDAKIGASCPRY